MAGDRNQDNRDGIRRDFRETVNMSPTELEKWLGSENSQTVGQHKGGGESVGHASGRRIVSLLRTRKDDLSDGDLGHMRKVTGYVHRHTAQRPAGRHDRVRLAVLTHELGPRPGEMNAPPCRTANAYRPKRRTGTHRRRHRAAPHA